MCLETELHWQLDAGRVARKLERESIRVRLKRLCLHASDAHEVSFHSTRCHNNEQTSFHRVRSIASPSYDAFRQQTSNEMKFEGVKSPVSSVTGRLPASVHVRPSVRYVSNSFASSFWTLSSQDATVLCRWSGISSRTRSYCCCSLWVVSSIGFLFSARCRFVIGFTELFTVQPWRVRATKTCDRRRPDADRVPWQPPQSCRDAAMERFGAASVALSLMSDAAS